MYYMGYGSFPNLEKNKRILLYYCLFFCCLAAFLRKFEFVLIFSIAFSSLLIPHLRFRILTLLNILAFFILNPLFYKATYLIRSQSFLLFLVFNSIFILVCSLLPQKRKNPFLSMIFVGILIFIAVATTNFFMKTSSLNLLILNPIIFSYWTYVSYLIHGGFENLNFFSKVLWLRPFWFSWVLPFGNTPEISKISHSPEQLDVVVKRVQSDAKFFSIFIIAFAFFENIFFNRVYYTFKIPQITSLMNFPYTHTDGFQVLLSGRYSQFEAFSAQFLSALHFLGNSYLYSTIRLISLCFSGRTLKPHTQNFMDAKSFTDYYFKISYYYSILIRYYFFKPLVSNFKFIKNHKIKLFLGIFISVSTVSMISSYLGRGLTSHDDFFSIEKIVLFLKNYHYAVVSALVCAISIVFEKSLTLSGKYYFVLQKIKVLVYLIISSILYTLIFNFLISDIDIRLKFLNYIIFGSQAG